MKLFRRAMSLILTMVLAVTSCACADTADTGAQVTVPSEKAVNELRTEYRQDNGSLEFDNSKWNYDADNNVYWQIGIQYCSNPQTKEYETMAVYVPGEYMTGMKNAGGTYTCELNQGSSVNGYTAETAPVVMPVDTGGYKAALPPSEYSYDDALTKYLDAGFVYVYPGCRGRDNGYDGDNNLTYSGGAPWGVTDLKAAIRYYRFNGDVLPGDSDGIFIFGHSGGGAQSSVLGASGDSELYFDYLKSIGAAMFDEEGGYISDSVAGVMAWCPITSLDYADEAYEWNMGQFSELGERAEGAWTSALSDDLAEEFAKYINALGLKDETGNVLTLEETKDGIYQAGSYYDYMVSVVEGSLNNFLMDTKFPYSDGPSSFTVGGDFPGGGKAGANPNGMKDGRPPIGAGNGRMPIGGFGGMPGIGYESLDSGAAKTYDTVQDYIDYLNSDVEWIEYDASTNTAKITGMEAFVKHCKNAAKGVGAFDGIGAGEAENSLFGNDENEFLHFDPVIARLLQQNKDEYSKYRGWDESVVSDYNEQIQKLDKLGNGMEYRMNAYNPMYYICSYYDGYKTSNAAKHWRIRTGINQGDTALTVEANLALALRQCSNVEDIDFETVWNQAHTTAERTGTSAENFIAWVNQCAAK